MTKTTKLILGILVWIMTAPLLAQCPGGVCQTRQYYWTPFGAYAMPASGACSGGKCRTQPKQAEAPADPEPAVVELKPFCQQVVELVNQARAQAGLAPLAADTGLSNGCESHSRYMRSYGFGHAYGAGRECIAYGVSTPQAVVRLWLNSSGHRAIILGGGSKIGVGSSGTFWTLRVR